MRKLVIIYHLLIFTISIIVNFVYFYDKSYSFHLLFISQIICFIGFYLCFKSLTNFDLNNKNTLKYLFGFNLIQIFTISFSGLTYKTIFGPQLFFSIRKYSENTDMIFKTELNYYMNQFYINYDSTEILFIGFNLIHFILAIYLLNIILKK